MLLSKLLIGSIILLFFSCKSNENRKVKFIQIELDRSVQKADSIYFELGSLGNFYYRDSIASIYIFRLDTVNLFNTTIRVWMNKNEFMQNNLIDASQSDTLFLQINYINNAISLKKKSEQDNLIIFSGQDKSFHYSNGHIVESYPFSVRTVINNRHILYINYSGDKLLGFDLENKQIIYCLSNNWASPKTS